MRRFPTCALVAIVLSLCSATARAHQNPFSYIDLHLYPGASFGKVQNEVFHTGLFLFYVAGLIAASWHFAYGIWLFCAKWGVITGEKAQKRLLVICLALFFVMTGAGLASLTAFRSRPQQPFDAEGARAIETEPPSATK